MTAHSDIEEFTVDDTWTNPEDVFEAVCEECSNPSRFEDRDGYSIDDTFEHHCSCCGSSQFPGLWNTTQFRVTDLSPDLEIHPVSTVPPIYSTDNAD